MAKQSVESDVSSVEGALAQTGQTTGVRKSRSKVLAQNDPVTQKGYTKLGSGGPAHTGKALPEKSKDNRGEGSM
jgi:hypothetical protein